MLVGLTRYTPASFSYRTTCSFFFFNDPATTEIYTLSLHDALPISPRRGARAHGGERGRPRRKRGPDRGGGGGRDGGRRDRRTAVVRADDGRGAAPPGRRHPQRGRRSGGDGDRDLGVHRGDERVDRRDVGHVPGPLQAGGRAGPAGARNGRRRGEGPADRHGAGLGRRRLGAPQYRRGGHRAPEQGGARPKHGAARETRR